MDRVNDCINKVCEMFEHKPVYFSELLGMSEDNFDLTIERYFLEFKAGRTLIRSKKDYVNGYSDYNVTAARLAWEVMGCYNDLARDDYYGDAPFDYKYNDVYFGDAVDLLFGYIVYNDICAERGM